MGMYWTWLVPIVSGGVAVSVVVDVWREYRRGDMNGARALAMATTVIAGSAATFNLVDSPIVAGALLAAFGAIGVSQPLQKSWKRKALPETRPPEQSGDGS